MIPESRSPAAFLLFLLRISWQGGWFYRGWMFFLLLLMAMGGWFLGQQWRHGLQVTGMSDQVMWGLYLGNFTFLVGVAAAGVVLVVPAFVFHRPWMERATPFGECLAITAVAMSLLFVLVDLGQPLRFWHALPLVGRLNFPGSILAWDIVVLSVYLMLNLGLLFYTLYRGARGRWPVPAVLFPWMMLAIFIGLGIHTVTAFMFSGLSARPFWNSAVLAPRFIASAFASGSGLLILAFRIYERRAGFYLAPRVVQDLALVMAFSMVIQLFLLASELFVHFYPPGGHGPSTTGLYLGWPGGEEMTRWYWLAILADVIAAIILVSHPLRGNPNWLTTASILAVVGIWIDKGWALVVPGFIPTPLGEVVLYVPTRVEVGVSLGIWGFGLFLFTLLTRAVMTVETRVRRGGQTPLQIAGDY